MTASRGFWMLLAASVALVTLGERSSAHASCGDYVVMGGHNHGTPAKPADSVDASSPRQPLPTRTPCNGPGCSQNQLPLTPPPAPPVPAAGEKYWGEASLLLPPSSGASISRVLDTIESRPLRGPISIYHPPR